VGASTPSLTLKRNLLGLTQMQMAQALGVSFQQVQKYEKGVNQLGPEGLLIAARLLGVAVEFFFEGAAAGAEKAAIMPQAEDGNYLDSRDGLELNTAFVRIQNPVRRQAIVELAITLSEQFSDPVNGFALALFSRYN